ncbi:hypothetical protein GCM10027425_26730 [Alteromonas gracilis]
MRDRDEVLRQLDGLVGAVESLFMEVRVEAVVATELSIQQLKVLMLAEHRGPVTAHEIAEELGVSAASVSGLVARLVERGLITQEQGATDRRVRILRPTDGGRVALEEVASVQLRQRRELLRRLTDVELEALATAMVGVERAVREVVADQTGSAGPQT